MGQTRTFDISMTMHNWMHVPQHDIVGPIVDSMRGPTSPHPHDNRQWRGVLHIVAALGLVLLTLSPGWTVWSLHVDAQESTSCVSGGPDTGAYLVEVCLTAPKDGAVVSGDVPVKARLELQAGTLPEIEFAQFYFTSSDRAESASVLRDYEAPFSFSLPTDRWADGSYRLEVDVDFDDGQFTTQRIGIQLTTDNGVTRLPTSTGRWKPYAVKDTGPADPVEVAVVGDGASGLPSTYQVADLIERWDPDMLLYLGDVYNVGSYAEFMNYYDPTLGRMKAITNPVPGDHEGGRNFQGYRDYWDSNQHYYATTAGSWRLIGLDSTDRFGELHPGTTQFDWLKARLAEDDDDGCTLVYLHNPRWGLHTNYDYNQLDDLWQLFVDEGVDLVIAGHEHNYQRWLPMDGAGVADPSGPTQIVVGTGGHKLIPFKLDDDRVMSAFKTFGALRLELAEGSASYEFIDTENAVLDSGTVGCGGTAATPVAPDPTVAPPTGTIVNTNGLGALCLVAPDEFSEVIAVLPDGTAVELRGAPEEDWQPVRCDGRDGYVYGPLISVGAGVPDG